MVFGTIICSLPRNRPKLGENPATTLDRLPQVTYGFIGLGQMGYPMAQNLRSKIPKSSKLVVCDVVATVRERFLKETVGLTIAVENPKSVAEEADIILTMLLESQHVTAAFTESATGLLTARKSSRKLFIECSTIDVETSIAVSEAVKSSGLGSFVDAPVSGDPNGAKSATLTFMVGGSKQLFEEVFPLLCTMGKKESVFHCGPLGAGLATKQINNYLLGVIMIGVSEAMDMGIRFGLDPQILSSVINVSSGNCYNSLDQNPVKGVTTTSAVTKDFEGGFSMELCKGVLEMAIKLEKDVGPRSILSSVVASALERVSQSEKCKGKDCREASTNGLPI